MPRPPARQPEIRSPDPNQDFGLGARVSQGSRRRLLNKDGGFNVVRRGVPFWRSLTPYHVLLQASWTSFIALIAGGYLLTNLLFAAGYVACGPGALDGARAQGLAGRFLESFFFSVHTLATIGYGNLSPHSVPAQLLVTLEALVGLLGFALATGLLFSRFSRPTARIVFSRQAVVAPYRGITGLMLRVLNESSSQMVEVDATVSLNRLETQPDGRRLRRFHELGLERKHVMFFPLHWVIVHPIDETSPLHGISREEFEACEPELVVLVTGVDETFAQTLHARSSYAAAEVVFSARFRDMFLVSEDGRPTIDTGRLHDIEPVEPLA